MSEICAEGIFATFPWWLENVKSRSKIALFSNERHFEIWFPKKRTITFFWSKLSKLHKKRPNFACCNYIFPKTRGNKNKPWTHSTPLNLKQSDSHSIFCTVNCFWPSSMGPDSVAKRFQNRSILLYTKRPKSSELPGAPLPPGAHSDLLSPRFPRYALTFLNWSSAPSTSKNGSAGPARIFQQQFLKRNMSDLSQSWALGWIYLSLCNRPIFMLKSFFMYPLISNKVTVTVYFAQ